jgi:hypothetical protein
MTISPNISPIYSLNGDVSTNAGTVMNQAILLAANDYTGVNANNALCFTAGVNGSFIQRLRFKASGTNVATVIRIFLNNGSVHTTATNNSFYGEISLPATAASASAGTVDLDYPKNFAIPAGFTIYVGLGTAVAGGWVVVPIAGDY